MDKISDIVVRIAMGLQRCGYVSDLTEEHDRGKPDVALTILHSMQNPTAQPTVNNLVPEGHTTTLREFLRTSFEQLGIDIEFSGKGQNEKAVVIDLDEERLNQLGLNTDTLRFGETVIRVGRQ